MADGREMTVEEVRAMIEGAREHNRQLRVMEDNRRIVEAAVRRLDANCGHSLRPERCDREDYLQQCWEFLFSPEGQTAIENAAATVNPDAYLLTAVYRHVLRYASNQCNFGRYNYRRKVSPMSPDAIQSRPDPASGSGHSEVELRFLLAEAEADVRRYLEGVQDGSTDGEMMESFGWSRTTFECIRAQAMAWLTQLYPDEVSTIQNAVQRNGDRPPELFNRMEHLFRCCLKEDKAGSVLFLVDDAACHLWGSLVEPVSVELGRPVRPGPRLSLELEEVLPSLGRYMEPASVAPPGKFWFWELDA